MINNLLMKLAGMSYRTAAIAGLVAGFLFYNSSFYDDGSGLDRQINDLKNRVKEQQEKAAESDAALKEVDRIRKAVAALELQFKQVSQQLPTEIVMSDVLRTVDTLARTSSVSVKDKEPRPTLKQDFFEVYPLRIKAEGTFSDLTSFMYYLASTERITRVRNFTFQGESKKSRNGRLSFEGEVMNYRFVPPEPPPVKGSEKEKK